MFDDAFFQTQNSEIFVSSGCLNRENELVTAFSELLHELGYKNTSHRKWQRGNKTVIVCFADDFGVCRDSFNSSPQNWFNKNTVIITDNYLPAPTNYTVLQTPTSYFGIYNYVPKQQEFLPKRRFHFSINRVDSQRLLIFLEFIKQLGLSENDFINFNSRPVLGNMKTRSEVVEFYDQVWKELAFFHNTEYRQFYQQARDLVPIRNHNLTIEQASINAYINVVVETYAGDATIAFSEKIFRALVTPAPWTTYSALGAITYLESLGFDVLSDIVDHAYNQVLQDNTPYGIEKIKRFISSNNLLYQQLQDMNPAHLKERCLVAAQHNQRVLGKMASAWPTDFANWLPQVLDKIQ